MQTFGHIACKPIHECITPGFWYSIVHVAEGDLYRCGECGLIYKYLGMYYWYLGLFQDPYQKEWVEYGGSLDK